MRGALRSLLVPLVVVVGMVFALPAAGAAAVPSAADPPAVGYDVSFPQCDRSLPRQQAFAIVGVNGGVPTGANPCLADQLRWARGSNGSGGQPAVQLYLNTADPGRADPSGTWPTSGTTPYGQCEGGNTTACSWQYGWERARTSVTGFFTPAALDAQVDPKPSSYTWWLDVETANTWQYGSTAAQARNRAVLEGQAGYLRQAGARVGVYGLAPQWLRIVGGVSPNSPLYRLDSWLAGGRTLAGASANCDQAPLAPGGDVVLAQFVSGDLDHNLGCG